jgi:imidazoleglycerol-phosphate dehydratase
MLTLFAAHSLIDLDVVADGDLNVDGHHTCEDIGLVLGQAFANALAFEDHINRYGHFTLPMDETLVTVAVDFSGRPYLAYNVNFNAPKIGTFDVELLHEFWQAFSVTARCNLHILQHYGVNRHHIAEAIFKAAAHAIRMAIEIDPRRESVLSTKGVL